MAKKNNKDSRRPKSKKNELKASTNAKNNGNININTNGSSVNNSSNISEINKTNRIRNTKIVANNSSWTGKLPCSLLHELVQKNHWKTVAYDMVKIPTKDGQEGGFIANSKISWENPKTKQLITINFKATDKKFQEIIKPQSTPIEARHLCATFTLHKISYEKNLQMILPTNHRKVWQDLDKLRVILFKENKQKYQLEWNSDPFKIYLENQKSMQNKLKQNDINLNQQLKTQKPQLINISNSTQLLNQSKSSMPQKNQNQIYYANRELLQNSKINQTTRFPRKIWEKAPFIDLSPESTQFLQSVINKNLNHIYTSNNIPTDNINSEKILQYFESIGFRKPHIQESFQYISHISLTSSLEWLLLNVPEDDLPTLFLKNDNVSNVSLKLISNDLKSQYMFDRLLDSGYLKNDIVVQFNSIGKKKVNNPQLESFITYNLTKKLIDDSNIESYNSILELNDGFFELEDYKNEVESLVSMYSSDKFKIIDKENYSTIEIFLNPENFPKDQNIFSLRILYNKSVSKYPFDLLGLQFNIIDKKNYKMANYIKSSILGQLVNDEIIGNNMLGNCYLLSIIEWLESNISKIIQNPGPLIHDNNFEFEVDSSSQGNNSNIKKNKNKNTNKNKKSFALNTKVFSIDEIDNLLADYQKKHDSIEVKARIFERKKLPAFNRKDQLVSMIQSSQITIVTGETGSGKSTQIVQFILDDIISKNKDFVSKIIVTQPRRISTIGLADRISDERVLKVGEEVGYMIRGENRTKNNTRIIFVTTGILLRMIQGFLSKDQKKNSKDDEFLKNVKYIFVDEVHERSIDSDFLLIILKQIVKSRKLADIKIILMSATIDINLYKQFFKVNEINHVHIEGRTFPIKDYYLDSVLNDLNFTIVKKVEKKNKYQRRPHRYNGDEDDKNDLENSNYYDSEGDDELVLKPKADSRFFNSGKINNDLISQLVNKVDLDLLRENNTGSILIFLPGIMEINMCIKNISSNFHRKSKCILLPLHSALSPQQQKKVFKTFDKTVRKIVVTTNIAETSITIPDAVVVIDCGRAKQLHYDFKLNCTKLVEDWCSKAEIKQRRGRAGRIQSGICYHLYTRENYENNFLDQPIPEIKRVRIENIYLIIKSMGINNVSEFLKEGIDSPDDLSIIKTKKFLNEIGATNIEEEDDDDDKLTNLGKYLSMLPMDIRAGKLLIFGVLFGCLENCLTIGSVLTSGSPFLNSFNDRDEIKRIIKKWGNTDGDLISIVNVFNEYAKIDNPFEKRKFIRENKLSKLVLDDIVSTRIQYLSVLGDVGFIDLNYKSKINEIENENENGNGNGNQNKDKDKDKEELNRNNNNFKILKLIITSAYYPNIVKVEFPESKYLKSSTGTIEINQNDKQIKYFIRNEEFSNDGNENEDEASKYPANRAFLHPSSILFNTFNENDGGKEVSKRTKLSFLIYGASQQTTKESNNKLYLRDITPVTPLCVLLFGGKINYDLASLSSGFNKSLPGIVIDNWVPIRTWCKNGVLIKNIRVLLDMVIQEKLQGASAKNSRNIASILQSVESLIKSE
ncbi:RNA helicase [Ascoidea rubescens DSM 1968]|uniref:p-loop containing nucleoside triphosphate hydrolase protein n=1 Tax=Ascoidea rubescens DSM 1968 TaxID=1344418 RepID=A0A1D2VDV5_9ASCO|nr:P-loop containing nucleoside triphosphate hydrolase protein [Ascoidea rubescens DSM 1968]ODV59888.1 P-loop containing nucleoside triphosphate hydrolase protein [Ascoidea rubescens DSM 1968]